MKCPNCQLTWVCDAEGADTEVFTTRGAQLNVVAGVVVDAGLGQHRVVLDLTLSVMGEVGHKITCCTSTFIKHIGSLGYNVTFPVKAKGGIYSQDVNIKLTNGQVDMYRFK